jgi:sulfur relay (sulfurtransferase) DsrF/TusC family protein
VDAGVVETGVRKISMKSNIPTGSLHLLKTQLSKNLEHKDLFMQSKVAQLFDIRSGSIGDEADLTEKGK